ncbi:MULTISPECIES: hypothetical protein [Pirellulaceae]|uniref:Outer membrane biogenesis lipoprotein LolB n=1 Tax=Aporhodopirellula rubra TaxID=980271 RepID=A0A7W5E190_9BACT|nr:MULTISPECIES: hypothetical protein [Pirellulaceae]EMI46673.1 secreted protein [Rhodopirellula sp. SWK7]MBB3208276.1 outer membrane biogenesis lipoprotein LolB [Aporhodopirellula rubra]
MKTKRMIRPLCVALGLLLLPACSQNGGEAQKLTPPDNVDWAAIEAQGEAIAEAQNEGE